jgi:hypothetical protein
MQTDTPTPIPYINFDVNYSPLPLYYPKLPLSALEFQPAAYTQGTGGTIYVTIVIPLPEQMFIDLPVYIGFTGSREKGTYYCGIQLKNDSDGDINGRLGIMSFSIDITEQMSCHGQWEIQVTDPQHGQLSDSLGKVVMDANILPTEDPKP